MEHHKYGGFFSKLKTKPKSDCKYYTKREDSKPLFILDMSITTAEGYCSVGNCITWRLSHLGLISIGVALIGGGVTRPDIDFCVLGAVLAVCSIVSWLVLGEMLQIRRRDI